MIVDFKIVPEDSRLWIYQSNKDFTSADIEIIIEKTTFFLDNWKAHGKDLQASYLIKDKRFLVLAVNEKFNPIGGCSIDYSLQLVKDISNSINIDLLDRLTVNYRSANQIVSVNVSDLKNKIKNGSVSTLSLIHI